MESTEGAVKAQPKNNGPSSQEAPPAVPKSMDMSPNGGGDYFTLKDLDELNILPPTTPVKVSPPPKPKSSQTIQHASSVWKKKGSKDDKKDGQGQSHQRKTPSGGPSTPLPTTKPTTDVETQPQSASFKIWTLYHRYIISKGLWSSSSPEVGKGQEGQGQAQSPEGGEVKEPKYFADRALPLNHASLLRMPQMLRLPAQFFESDPDKWEETKFIHKVFIRYHGNYDTVKFMAGAVAGTSLAKAQHHFVWDRVGPPKALVPRSLVGTTLFAQGVVKASSITWSYAKRATLSALVFHLAEDFVRGSREEDKQHDMLSWTIAGILSGTVFSLRGGPGRVIPGTAVYVIMISGLCFCLNEGAEIFKS